MFLSKEVMQAKQSIALERLKANLIVQAKDTNNILSHSDKNTKNLCLFFFFFKQKTLKREQEENYELGAVNYWNRKYNVMKYKVEHNDEICFSNICSKAFCKINTDLLYQTTQSDSSLWKCVSGIFFPQASNSFRNSSRLVA